jgi:hypothetical protein
MTSIPITSELKREPYVELEYELVFLKDLEGAVPEKGRFKMDYDGESLVYLTNPQDHPQLQYILDDHLRAATSIAMC